MGDGRNERTNLVTELISAAVLAGSYTRCARMHPEAARGLLKLGAKWSERVAALADEILADVGFDLASASVAPPLKR
jgi:hypothetical protein